jgi:hypothetical protein
LNIANIQIGNFCEPLLALARRSRRIKEALHLIKSEDQRTNFEGLRQKLFASHKATPETDPKNFAGDIF